MFGVKSMVFGVTEMKADSADAVRHSCHSRVKVVGEKRGFKQKVNTDKLTRDFNLTGFAKLRRYSKFFFFPTEKIQGGPKRKFVPRFLKNQMIPLSPSNYASAQYLFLQVAKTCPPPLPHSRHSLGLFTVYRV